MTVVTKENTQDIYPLSPLQKGMLFHSLYDDGSTAYFEQLGFAINGDLDVETFQRAWEHVIAQTPVFRTVFKWSKVKEPLQIVLKDYPVLLEVLDFAGREDQDAAVTSFLQDDRSQPFDLEQGPLTRLTLIRLDERRHYFVWSRHHLIVDGWCISIVLKDLFTAYMALLAGDEPLRTTRRPYKDYIAWFLKQDKEAAKRFWTEYLGDFSSPTPLPVDCKDLSVEVRRVAEVCSQLTSAESDALSELARAERVTPNTVLQGLWALLLSKYGHTMDVVFGNTSSGRPADLKGAEEMVGLFINTLPLRVKLAPEMSVRELLQSVQASSLKIREFEYAFLPEVKACSQVPASQSLFDSIMVFENYPLDAFMRGAQGDFGVADVRTTETTSFPLAVVVEPGEGLRIRLQYSQELFERQTAGGMLDHLLNLVRDLLAGTPDRSLKELEMLDEPERQRVLKAFNDTGMELPEERRLDVLFSRTAARHARRPAIVFRGEELSYAELESRTNRLARALMRRGVASGVRVGILLPRSPEYIMAQLAVLKAGGAFVPIDPHYPYERIRLMLEDCGARVLLSVRGMDAPAQDIEVLALDEPDSDIWQEDAAPLEPGSGADSLAYVIYTSGSTGRPKGVQIGHGNVSNMCLWHVRRFAVDPEDRASHLAGVAFDASIWEIWPYLLTGACVVPLESGLDEMTPEDLADWMRANAITRSFVPTKFAEVFLAQHHDGLALKTFFTGGDRLSAVPGRHDFMVMNCYGPTETTVLVTAGDVSAWDNACGSPPIGGPIGNVQIYILDPFLRPVPVGVVGQIHVGGAQVGSGYLGQSEKTAEVFLPDPFTPGGGRRMYATGDLARWNPDGSIDFLGRQDFQVEIRGYRVEIGEIEAVLCAYAAIDECVVLGSRDAQGAVRLVAFYVAATQVVEGQLRAYLSESLPNYMIPAAFIHLDIFPMTANGKLDRNALCEMLSTHSEAAPEFVAPAEEAELLIASIWQDVLGVPQVGIHDNFFDLGGDSIISLQVVGRLKKQGLEIRPRDIFEHQTISELAGVVNLRRGVTAPQGAVTGQAPLTPIQRWFFELGLSNLNHFNQTLVFRCAVPLETGTLREALLAVINHHDALRLRFGPDSQECLAPEGAVMFDAKTVASHSELEECLDALQRGLDIGQGRVFSAGLYSLGSASYLVLTGHHLVVDGVSWRIIMEDLLNVYVALKGGQDVALPPKTTSFKQWAEDLVRYAQSTEVQGEARWWKELLSRPAGRIPVELDEGANDMASHALVRVSLETGPTGDLLREAHTAYHTEVSDLLLTALARALSSWTHEPCVQFDLEGHGREEIMEHLDVSRTVGWFTSLYPVVIDLGGRMDLDEQIRQVKETRASIPFKGVHYGMLRYLSGSEVVPVSHGEVLFNYLGQIGEAGLEGSFELTDELNFAPADEGNCRTHLIDINCKVEKGQLHIDVGFSRNRHHRATIEEFAHNLKGELLAVISRCITTEREGYTPSDFKLTDISQDQLDDLIDDVENL